MQFGRTGPESRIVIAEIGAVLAFPSFPAAPPTTTKGNPMKPALRYQSQLLLRRSYKPKRVLRIPPVAKLNFDFHPVRFGVKPQIKTYECNTS